MSRSLLLWFALVSCGCGDRPAADPPPPRAGEDSPSKREPPAASPPPSASRGSDAESPCDTEALGEAARQIAQRTSAWSPKTGTIPDFSFDAITAVWVHCPRLPDEAKFLLHPLVDHERMPSLADIAAAEGRPAPAVNDDPLDAELPGHSRFHGLLDDPRTEAAWAWRASMLCPDYPDIAKSVGRMSSTERRVPLWDRCLHRFEFVTREEYLRSRMESGRMGFALHRWLSDAGVEASVAETLGRALTLGGHWALLSPWRLELPAAEADTRVGGIPLIEVRPDAIWCAGHQITRIDPTVGLEGLESSGGVQFHPFLEQMVFEEIERMKQLAERGGPTWTPDVLLLAHRELTWSTLGPVIASASRAGVQRIAVVVLAKDLVDPLRSVVVHDARAADPPLEVPPTTTVQGLVDTIVARPGPVRLFTVLGVGSP